MNKTILVTGGLGYIGSHTVVSLLLAGARVIVIDNLSNSKRDVRDRIFRIAGRSIELIEGDVRDSELLSNLFADHDIDAVLHFAGLKSVSDSQMNPLEYYDVNVSGTINLVRCMNSASVKKLIFSSSATVYGAQGDGVVKYSEGQVTKPVNVYGQTKLMAEKFFQDLCASDNGWRVGMLRYFNPVGAHSSGLIGEDPRGIPNNLMPYVAQVAIGKLREVKIFGNDYPTPDGTGRRDFIHVCDLAEGHLAALDYIIQEDANLLVNLGTGRSCSVLELIDAFSKVSGINVPFVMAPKRSGDLPEYYADASLAKSLLGWEAKLTLEDMCRDAWNWQSRNA